jgi:hypothetical protein
MRRKLTISEKSHEASYLVAELTAKKKKKKSHTIAEGLIMPACKLVRTMLGKETESETGNVLVSDNTISRRMDDIHTALKMYCLKY